MAKFNYFYLSLLKSFNFINRIVFYSLTFALNYFIIIRKNKVLVPYYDISELNNVLFTKKSVF